MLFSRAEKLQLLNLRPTSHVELQLVSALCMFFVGHSSTVVYSQLIEEIDERFNEERIEQLLKVVATELPCSMDSHEANTSDH